MEQLTAEKKKLQLQMEIVELKKQLASLQTEALKPPRALKRITASTVLKYPPSKLGGELYLGVPSGLQNKFIRLSLTNGKELFKRNEQSPKCWSEKAEFFYSQREGKLVLRTKVSSYFYHERFLESNMKDYCMIGDRYLCCVYKNYFMLYDFNTNKEIKREVYGSNFRGEGLQSVIAISEKEFLVRAYDGKGALFHYQCNPSLICKSKYDFNKKIKAMVLSPDKKKIAVYGYSHTKVFELSQFKTTQSLDTPDAHSGESFRVYFTPDSSHLVIIPQSRGLKLWNYSQNTVSTYGEGNYMSVIFVDEKNMIAVATNDDYETYQLT